MPDTDPSAETTATDGADEPDESAVSDAVRSTKSYETEAGVVFYDADNPLAWLQADHAVDLESAA
ncbi:uncharacterized protein Nmlp_1696 [Natronomonas moolapensis 8.8.11]|uniref:Uncharacterized protein n=1 Tax=Natronomonas moolapensis (strain DSM 18674 / CECT 7526 / JCM 14361 / 8.8.11) TaxID=268739 RepID=M1Y0C3_NATM8|nr:hypothetical protein [Natronomonas moolapensis]CCQ35891.1 uncharacterized protein Nmlp_1696 [Natronomonas moolapensis 8.8.11]